MPSTPLLDTFYFRVHSDISKKMFDIIITDSQKKILLTYQHLPDSIDSLYTFGVSKRFGNDNLKLDTLSEIEFHLKKLKHHEHFMVTFIQSRYRDDEIAFWITRYSNEYIIYLKDTCNDQYICQTIRIRINRRNTMKMIKMFETIRTRIIKF